MVKEECLIEFFLMYITSIEHTSSVHSLFKTSASLNHGKLYKQKLHILFTTSYLSEFVY